MSETTPAGGFPWPGSSATGVGPLPGTDPAEAMRLIFGELPDLPHLAEIPGRGPGADLTGRTAALLVDLPVETSPAGWRFADRPGRDLQRARGMLSADLDALEETASGYAGPLKVQLCGPWTLAATIELARSQDPALADAGAVTDLTESLVEGASAHVAEVRRRVPGATVLLQLDEPSLPAVLAAEVPTASGLNRLPAPDAAGAEAGLRSVISAARAFSVVHCCAAPVPFGIIKGSGAGAAGFGLSRLRREDEDALAEAVEAGLGIFAGVIPVTAPVLAAGEVASAGPPASGDAERASAGQPPSPRRAAERVIELWRRMGWPASRRAGVPAAGPASITGQVVLTPDGGLAGVTPDYARAALARSREAARLLPELIEEGHW